MKPCIAIIGGGSAHWTPRLLLDFVNTPSLAESQVVLMDTAPESLPPGRQLADLIAASFLGRAVCGRLSRRSSRLRSTAPNS